MHVSVPIKLGWSKLGPVDTGVIWRIQWLLSAPVRRWAFLFGLWDYETSHRRPSHSVRLAMARHHSGPDHDISWSWTGPRGRIVEPHGSLAVGLFFHVEMPGWARKLIQCRGLDNSSIWPGRCTVKHTTCNIYTKNTQEGSWGDFGWYLKLKKGDGLAYWIPLYSKRKVPSKHFLRGTFLLSGSQ